MSIENKATPPLSESYLQWLKEETALGRYHHPINQVWDAVIASVARPSSHPSIEEVMTRLAILDREGQQ